jgi:adenylate cyclase
MGAKRYEATIQRTFDAPRPLVWALVSDSNRFNRGIGLAAATYRWERDPKTGQQVRIASAKELGLDLGWIEPPYEWIEGRYIETNRIFVKGPAVDQAGSFAYLEDAEGGGTKLTIGAWVTGRGWLAVLLGPIQRMKFRRGLNRFMDALAELLANGKDDGDESEPAAMRARRLLGQADHPVAVGPKTQADLTTLRDRETRLRAAPIEGTLVDHLVSHVRDRPDEEVSQMRPFELARQWHLPRRDVLRAFLYATHAGVVDLQWQINCPVCRVGASFAPDLASVNERSHCAACEIDYDTDFGQHVEAVFGANEGVRPVTTELYCASSPAFLPHVFTQIRARKGDPIEKRIDLPLGPIHLRVRGRAGGVDVDIGQGPERLVVHVGEETLDAHVEPSDASTIVLTSDVDEPALVLIERAGWAADAVLGSVMASFPEFLDLFATEAPARGVELRVGHIALMFTDLVGSTALYQKVGDARAFAIVEEHFRQAATIIAASNGAIVKTMGDAVMATFPTLKDAVSASIRMYEENEGLHPEHRLGVKIGAYAGPCLAVRANDRLDYFGTTVNLAARLQAQASNGELVLTAENALDPAIQPLLEGLAERRFRTRLKGIVTEQDLVGFAFASKKKPKERETIEPEVEQVAS